MNESYTLSVKYACVDGMHFFTSGDVLTKGLCAGSMDLKTAYDEVSYQLEYLFKKNHGEEFHITPSVSYEEISEWIELATNTSRGTIHSIPSAVIDWATQNAA